MLDLLSLEGLPNTWLGKITNFIRYFKGYSLFPFFITFIITYRCNLRCNFCYQKNLFKDYKELDFNFDDIELIEKNINSFSFKPKIHIFGGEPMLHKNFMDIMKYFDERGNKLYVTSNGTKLKCYSKELMNLKNLKEINISLNIDNWNLLVKKIEKLKEGKNLRINVIFTLSSQNCHKISRIIENFKNSNIDSVVLQHLIFSNNNTHDVDTNSIISQVSRIENNLKPSFRFFPPIKIQDIKNYYENPNFPNKNKCLKPWFVVIILPNGDVIPCDQENPKLVGNIKRESLAKIWNNDKFRSFREKIQSKGLNDNMCFRCCHRQFY